MASIGRGGGMIPIGLKTLHVECQGFHGICYGFIHELPAEIQPGKSGKLAP
jgi:hypothetical protein